MTWHCSMLLLSLLSGPFDAGMILCPEDLQRLWVAAWFLLAHHNP
jgi:hypothetical protein